MLCACVRRIVQELVVAACVTLSRKPRSCASRSAFPRVVRCLLMSLETKTFLTEFEIVQVPDWQTLVRPRFFAMGPARP
jgi:hypothetical protein